MIDPWVVLPLLGVLALVFVVIPVGATALGYWRRPLRLTCPRAGAEAQIRVNAVRAAARAVAGRGPAGIERCSLWPLRGCREECLALPAGALRSMRRGEAPPRAGGGPGLRTILVPVDGSRDGESALDAVAELARAHGATVRFVHVARRVETVRSEDDTLVVAFVDQESERLERETRAYFKHLQHRLPGVTVEGAVRFGDPMAEIVEEAESAGADLIALASHRRDALGRLIKGSLARRLEHETTIPLLLVPYGERAVA